MSSAIANALSGLDANSTAINVVSGNLANLNTTGYKDVQVSFEDLVNQSLSGFTNSRGGQRRHGSAGHRSSSRRERSNHGEPL